MQWASLYGVYVSVLASRNAPLFFHYTTSHHRLFEKYFLPHLIKLMLKHISCSLSHHYPARKGLCFTGDELQDSHEVSPRSPLLWRLVSDTTQFQCRGGETMECWQMAMFVVPTERPDWPTTSKLRRHTEGENCIMELAVVFHFS